MRFFPPPHSCHVGVHWIWATRRNGTTDSVILFYVNLEMDGSCGFIRTLTRPYRRLRGRQTRIFQLSSTMRGGKLEIAFMLRAHMAEAFQSDFLSSFYSLLLLVGGSWVAA